MRSLLYGIITENLSLKNIYNDNLYLVVYMSLDENMISTRMQYKRQYCRNKLINFFFINIRISYDFFGRIYAVMAFFRFSKVNNMKTQKNGVTRSSLNT